MGEQRLGRPSERLAAAATVYRIDARLVAGASVSPDHPPSRLADALSDTGARATLYDGRWMWAAERVGRDVLLTVRLDATVLDEQRSQLRGTIATAGVAALVVGGLLGWLAAVGVSRRLRLAASLAAESGDRVAAGGPGLGARVGGRDEVAALTHAVDAMATSLAMRVQRERRFGAHVAHELRTPLTALVSSTELLPDDEPGRLVRGQVGRLRRLVEDLLELFRADSGQAELQLVELDAAEAVANAVDALPGSVDLVVEASEPVAVDPRRLERVLANLTANARVHGGVAPDAPVRIRVSGRAVTVEDDGPGLPADLLAEGPQPFRRHSGRRGSGLGLALVQAQVELMGAGLTLAAGGDGTAGTSAEPRAEGGARAIVTLAPPHGRPAGEGR